MLSPKPYDLIIIGSGGGLALAAAELGWKVALVEKEKMGGTCLNRGCIPSKMLIYPAEVAEFIKNAGKHGLRTSKAYHANFSGIVKRISRIVDRESRVIQPQGKKLDVYRATARFAGKKILDVGGKRITAGTIVIAAGARPQIPLIDGLNGTPYMTSTEALRNAKLPKKMIVIGGGYIAAELGYAYQSLGCEVHFLVRSGLLGREDKDIRAEFSRVFTKHHHVHLGWSPVRVRYASKSFMVTAEDKNGRKKEFIADALLIATGVVPNSDTLGLAKTGVGVNDKGFIRTDKHLETTMPGIYAIGDVAGNYLFRHSVNFEADYLIRALLIRKNKIGKPIDYGAMPHAVFTHPQIAGCGATEDELLESGKKANRDYVVGIASYPDTAMGLARRLDHGIVKVIVDKKTRKILGAHIVGDEASTMIHVVIALMYVKRAASATIDDLLSMVYIHPALPEVVRNAAEDAAEQLR
ncbi:dihydrolipoyl dehydrogenase [Candidatus Woesearchaeota archaeon]|nr:dihydrolipoyl dehydrogenase [Candidatus Woesearchaeota archaeon]